MSKMHHYSIGQEQAYSRFEHKVVIKCKYAEISVNYESIPDNVLKKLQCGL